MPVCNVLVDMLMGSTCGCLRCVDYAHRGRHGPFSAFAFCVHHRDPREGSELHHVTPHWLQGPVHRTVRGRLAEHTHTHTQHTHMGEAVGYAGLLNLAV